jgi:hypothetical protein
VTVTPARTMREVPKLVAGRELQVKLLGLAGPRRGGDDIAMHAAIIRADGVDLTQLIEAAREADLEEAVVVGSAIGDHLIDNPRPDFVIGVLGPTHNLQRAANPPDPAKAAAFSNFDVMLRVGMTTERRIPTFLVVPPPLAAPTGPTSLVVAACPLDDLESLRLHLWAFTATLSGRHQPNGPEVAEGAGYVDAKRLIRLLNAFREEGNPGAYSLQIEQFVLQLFKEAEVELAEDRERGRRDEGFDMAALASRLSDDVVLIEVKAGRLTERRVHDAELRLQEAITNRRSRLGLLVYHDADGRRFPLRQATPLVVRIALQDLVERLGEQSFLGVLTEEMAQTTERI